MRNFLFYDTLGGEHYLIGADSERQAWNIAHKIEDDVTAEYGGCILCYQTELSDWEAEASGLDEW